MAAIRILKFEVFRVAGDYKATRKRWLDLSAQVQEAINCVWQAWLCWHVERGTPKQLRRFYAQLRAWHETKRGAKPKWEVQAISKPCAKAIYDALADACPDLHASTRELARNITQGKITSGKASKGNLPRWHAILMFRESIPSSTRKQPIPFTKKVEQTRLIPPDKDCQQWRVSLRLDRTVAPGAKRATISEPDLVELRTNAKGMHGQTAMLKRIVAGTAELCGSSLLFDDRRNKWFVCIAYRAEKSAQPAVDPNKKAILIARRGRPWSLRIVGGRKFNLQGEGRTVAHVRKTMLSGRWGRQENYRFAQRAGKGHGVERAMGWKDQFMRNWRNLCTSLNHDLTQRVVSICQEHGIGTIIYAQPEGAVSESRFLATAGKIPGRNDSSGWAWFQVASQLQYKTEGTGIAVEVKKWARKNKGSEEESGAVNVA